MTVPGRSALSASSGFTWQACCVAAVRSRMQEQDQAKEQTWQAWCD